LGAQLSLSIIIENLYPEKPSFRPSKWPHKLKLLKIVNCQNFQKIVLSGLEKVEESSRANSDRTKVLVMDPSLFDGKWHEF
jgi:hypothetical protein